MPRPHASTAHRRDPAWLQRLADELRQLADDLDRTYPNDGAARTFRALATDVDDRCTG